MAEKPIIFSTEMVQAILDGRKTMTRRVVKPQGITCYKGSYRKPCTQNYILNTAANSLYCGECGNIVEYSLEGKDYCRTIDCPYQPGDLLWVRETWAGLPPFHNLHPEIERYIYKADGDATPLKWKSPRFMPKAAARIWLEVTSVRVERLQEITAEDIRSEGLTSMAVHCLDYEIAVVEYQLLWDSINAKRGHGWDTNPWVWVIEFERSK